MLRFRLALGLAVAVGACDSSLNLGNGADAGASDGGGGGTCDSVCAKLTGCGFFTAAQASNCAAECAQSPQSEIACALNNACADIPRVCAGAGIDPTGLLDAGANEFGIQTCQSDCQNLLFFNCANAEGQSTCRSLCASAPADKRDTYTACADTAGSDCTQILDCFTTFEK